MTNAEGQQQLEERQRQEEEAGLAAQAAQDKINDYANAMTKRDVAGMDDPRNWGPEHDMPGYTDAIRSQGIQNTKEKK